MRTLETQHIFLDGAIGHGEKLVLIVFDANPHTAGRSKSPLILYKNESILTFSGPLDIQAVGIDILKEVVFVLDRDGGIARLNNDSIFYEHLPGVLGPMRGIRQIDGRIFAYGMNWDIYERQSNGHWSKLEVVLVKKHERQFDNISEAIDDEISSVSGFTAIARSGKGRVCAVGYCGEVFECFEGRWSQLDSPTNVILTDVAGDVGTGFYACGYKETILFSPSAGVWQVIANDALDMDFSSIQIFNGQIFLSDRFCLYSLAGNRIEPVKQASDGGDIPCRKIYATNNMLMAVAPKSVHLTMDGLTWSEALLT